MNVSLYIDYCIHEIIGTSVTKICDTWNSSYHNIINNSNETIDNYLYKKSVPVELRQIIIAYLGVYGFLDHYVYKYLIKIYLKLFEKPSSVHVYNYIRDLSINVYFKEQTDNNFDVSYKIMPNKSISIINSLIKVASLHINGKFSFVSKSEIVINNRLFLYTLKNASSGLQISYHDIDLKN
jgi:hypothetical protein